MIPEHSFRDFFYFCTKRQLILARILSLDYGQKRTGIAVTDPLQLIANRLATVNTHELMAFLEAYFSREQVETVVVGFPKKMNNLPSEAVKFIEPFIVRFRKRWPDKTIVLMDERFTSKIAFQTMLDGGLKKKDRRRKELIDAISATIILQSYLDSIKQE